MQFNGDAHSTRFLERNICNLGYAQYEGVGAYDIPELEPIHIDNLKDIPIQGFNYALKEQHPENIGVHFFLHDYQFERVWKYPDRYVEVLKKFAFVLSPDFSVYYDTPKVIQLYNLYRNRWLGKYWQEHGIKVIPTFSYGDVDLFNVFCDGIPKNSTIAVSTMGDGRWGKFASLKAFWETMLWKLKPDTILLYGKDLSKDLRGDNIIFKQMINSKVAL